MDCDIPSFLQIQILLMIFHTIHTKNVMIVILTL